MAASDTDTDTDARLIGILKRRQHRRAAAATHGSSKSADKSEGQLLACDPAGDTRPVDGDEVQHQALEDKLEVEQLAPDVVGNDTTWKLTRQANQGGSRLPIEQGRVRFNLHGRSRVAGSLNATLRNATALGHFIQYMETQKYAIMFIQFWLNAESYRQSMLHLSKEEPSHRRSIVALQSDAMSIYNTFFSLQAPRSQKFLQCLGCVVLPRNDDAGGPEEHMQAIRVEVENTICQPGGPDNSCFLRAQELCHEVLERVYFAKYLDSAFYSQYLLEELTAGGLTVHDVLNNTVLLSSFLEYTHGLAPSVAEGSRPPDLVQLWIGVRSFKDLAFQRSNLEGDACTEETDRLRTAAVALYNKFLSWQAYNPVNVPPAVRRDIEVNISHPAGPQINCFETAQRYAFEVMEEHLFTDFLRSVEYDHLLRRLSDHIPGSLSGSLSSMWCSGFRHSTEIVCVRRLATLD